MRRYGAPHRVIVSSLNCHAGLNHALETNEDLLEIERILCQRGGTSALADHERGNHLPSHRAGEGVYNAAPQIRCLRGSIGKDGVDGDNVLKKYTVEYLPCQSTSRATSKSCDRRSTLTPQPPLPERERGSRTCPGAESPLSP